MIRHTRFAVPLLFLALVTACAPRDEPAPVVQHNVTVAAVTSVTPHPSSRPASTTAPMFRPGATVVVSRGETLNAIARRHGTDPATIARLNNLKAPYGVQAGQRLSLPDSPQAAVATAQPVSAAPPARAKPAEALKPLAIRAASIPPPAAEPVSQLTVPSVPRSGVQSAPLAAPEPAKPLPAVLRVEKVEPAKSELAQAPGVVKVEPVKSEPAVSVSGILGVLKFEPGKTEPTPPAAVAKAEAPVPSLPVVIPSELRSTFPPVSRPKPVVAVEAESRITPVAFQATPPKTALDEPPPRAGRHFMWPVKGGRMISSYGPQPGGLRNDGFNIAASRGSNVVAADNGVVAYAGGDLKGFGNLVLIKHAGGFVTTYAHNEKLLVKRGDRVKRGQVVATVGDSGSVTQPQVHFQIRQGAHAVDPRPLMERSS